MSRLHNDVTETPRVLTEIYTDEIYLFERFISLKNNNFDCADSHHG